MVARALWTTYIECRVHPPGKEAAHFKLWKVLQTPELDRDLDSAASTRLLEIRWRNSASPSPTLSCSHIYMSIVENFNARWTQGKQRDIWGFRPYLMMTEGWRMKIRYPGEMTQSMLSNRKAERNINNEPLRQGDSDQLPKQRPHPSGSSISHKRTFAKLKMKYRNAISDLANRL